MQSNNISNIFINNNNSNTRPAGRAKHRYVKVHRVFDLFALATSYKTSTTGCSSTTTMSPAKTIMFTTFLQKARFRMDRCTVLRLQLAMAKSSGRANNSVAEKTRVFVPLFYIKICSFVVEFFTAPCIRADKGYMALTERCLLLKASSGEMICTSGDNSVFSTPECTSRRSRTKTAPTTAPLIKKSNIDII